MPDSGAAAIVVVVVVETEDGEVTDAAGCERVSSASAAIPTTIKTMLMIIHGAPLDAARWGGAWRSELMRSGADFLEDGAAAPIIWWLPAGIGRWAESSSAASAKG